jgi:PAS domain S-box-containing protein
MAVATTAAEPDTDTMMTESPQLVTARGEAAGFTSDSLLSMVLDRTTDGVVVTDGRGLIVYVNAPLLELFGYDAEDLVGQPVEVLLPDDLRDNHRHHVHDFLANPNPRPMGREDLDIEGRRADGSLFSIDVQLNALPGTSLVVATIRDMTQQRQKAVDCAIARIDLGNASSQVDRLQGSLDLVIQRLFALGTSIAASAANESVLSERLSAALHGIDEIIEAVQDGRQAVGP